MSDYRIGRLPMDIPPSPGCEQCACEHNRWVSYERFADLYRVVVCLDCDHRRSERTAPLTEVKW